MTSPARLVCLQGAAPPDSLSHASLVVAGTDVLQVIYDQPRILNAMVRSHSMVNSSPKFADKPVAPRMRTDRA